MLCYSIILLIVESSASFMFDCDSLILEMAFSFELSCSTSNLCGMAI